MQWNSKVEVFLKYNNMYTYIQRIFFKEVGEFKSDWINVLSK